MQAWGEKQKRALQQKRLKCPDSSIWTKLSFLSSFTNRCLQRRETEYLPHWGTVWYSCLLLLSLSRLLALHCGGNLRSTTAGSLATKLSFIYPLKICTSQKGWGDIAASIFCPPHPQTQVDNLVPKMKETRVKYCVHVCSLTESSHGLLDRSLPELPSLCGTIECIKFAW